MKNIISNRPRKSASVVAAISPVTSIIILQSSVISVTSAIAYVTYGVAQPVSHGVHHTCYLTCRSKVQGEQLVAQAGNIGIHVLDRVSCIVVEARLVSTLPVCPESVNLSMVKEELQWWLS